MKKWILPAAAAVVAVAVLAALDFPRCRTPIRRPAEGGIVSLTPSTTEIVFGLGLGDRLVGVTTACDYPPPARKIRRIGDLGAPNIELIYALKPTLVITTSLRDPEMAKAIRRSGAQLLVVKQATLANVSDAILEIGKAANAAEAARSYAEQVRQRIERATVEVPREQRPRVFVELSSNPLRTAGGASFLQELIDRAGGRNIAEDIDNAWILIAPEAVIARDPEIIILAHPAKGDARATVARRVGWQNVSALKSGIVTKDIDLDVILRPGPRLAEGIEVLARLFAKYREGRRP